jgi:hypothetical protein
MSFKFKLLLFFILTSLGSYSQKQEEFVMIDTSLIQYVNSFIEEGRSRGFDPEPHIMKLDSIKFTSKIPKFTLGLYIPRISEDNLGNVFDRSVIHINSITTIDWLCVRSTIYHELAHACGYLKHSCYECEDIMTANTSGGHTYAYELDPKVWSDKLDKMFKQIKEYNNEKNGVE